MNVRRATLAACLLRLLHIALGQLFVPRLGIEGDESLFAAPVLNPRAYAWAVHVGNSTLAVMVMAYIGTVKTMLMGPMVRNFGGNVWVVREPALLIGVASIWIFYRLLCRIATPRAAVIGCALLATDTLYLLTSVFDWGPVALQHLLITASMLCAIRFYQERGAASLAAAGFLAGLALWDKALGIWMLSGLAVAALAVFPRQIFAVTTARRAGIAAAGFLLGAAPLIAFNLTHGGATFRGNVKMDGGNIHDKAWLMLFTIRGEALLGYLAMDAAPAPRNPVTTVERASAALASAVGEPRRNLNLYALAAALLLVPFAPAARRTAIFALLAAALAWAQMMLNPTTGSSAHHTILLWPLPILIIAVMLDSVRRTSVVAAVAVVLCLTSLAVTNTYLAHMVRYGGSTSWNDAVFPLSRTLLDARAPAVYCVDWGIIDALRLISGGKLQLRNQEFDEQSMRAALADDTYLFVGKTPNYESIAGSTTKVTAFAAGQGQTREIISVINDSYGRPIFEIYRFVRSQP